MRTKRLALSIGGLAFTAAMLLAGCGSPSSSSSGPVTVNYWYTEGPNEAPAIKDLISKFEQQNPNIKVNAQYVDFGSAHDKFVTAAQAGTAPDVLRSDVGWNTEFAADGYLYDITSMESASDKSQYLAAPLAYATYQGKLYGLPQVTDFLVLYYNKSMLQKDGVSAAPKTWAEFQADCEKIGKTCWSFEGSSYFAQQFIFSYGGGLIDDTTNPPTVLIGNAQSVKGLQELKTLLAYAPTVDFTNGYTNTVTGFKNGQYAMMMNGPWEYTNILGGTAFKSDASNLGIAAIPYDAATGDVPRSPAGGQNYVMYKATKHPAEAFKFMSFMSSASSQAYIAAKNSTLPTRKDAYQDPSVQSTASVQAFAALLSTQKARPVIKQAGAIYAPQSQFDPNLQKFINGQEDAQTAATNIAKGFQSLLAS